MVRCKCIEGPQQEMYAVYNRCSCPRSPGQSCIQVPWAAVARNIGKSFLVDERESSARQRQRVHDLGLPIFPGLVLQIESVCLRPSDDSLLRCTLINSRLPFDTILGFLTQHLLQNAWPHS